MIAFGNLINALGILGIRTSGEPKADGWMLILCPYHPDKNMTNAFIHTYSGNINCFSCGTTGSIFSLVMAHLSCSYHSAKEYLGIESTGTVSHLKNKISNRKKTEKPELKYEPDLKKRKRKIKTPKLDTKPIDVDKWKYFSNRGVTPEIAELWGIRECVDEWFYEDYAIIPIIDSSRRIHTFEARKFKEYEIKRDFFKLPIGTSEAEVENAFINFKDEYNIHKEGKKLMAGSIPVTDPTVWYFFKPKTLYPTGSNLKKTIFNIDNLSIEDDLYIREGITGLAKVYSNLSKNCTTTFGTKTTSEQMEILNTFRGRKIIIPDDDIASWEWVSRLKAELDDCYVIPVKADDKQEEFVDQILNNKMVTAAEYFVDYANIFRV